jgi:hypothetical protein
MDELRVVARYAVESAQEAQATRTRVSRSARTGTR